MTAEAPERPVSLMRARTARYTAAPLAAVLFAMAGAVGVFLIFMRTALGQAVDTAAMLGGDVHHPKVVAVLSQTLNGTTFASVVLVCLVVAAVGVLRKRIDLAVGSALMVIGSNASTQLLKTRIHRPNLDAFPAPNSFPSGHTAAAASVAFALVLVLPAAVRGVVTLIGFGYVTVIAIATVWAEWHRPSDTIAALFIVVAWGALASFGIRVWRLRGAHGAERTGRITTVTLLAIAAVTGLLGLLGGGAVVVAQRVSTDFVSARFTFLSGSACITAAAASAFLLWLRLAATDAPAPGNHDRVAANSEQSEGHTIS